MPCLARRDRHERTDLPEKAALYALCRSIGEFAAMRLPHYERAIAERRAPDSRLTAALK
jgi:hypothetical protein